MAEDKLAAVFAADDRRLAASVAGDTDALETILASDFTYIHNTGFREGRAAYLERMREGSVQITGMKRLTAGIRQIGEVVLVEGQAAMSYRMPASAPEARFTSLYLAVWHHIENCWQLRAYASTLIGAEQKS